jgi:archaellum component FlaC
LAVFVVLFFIALGAAIWSFKEHHTVKSALVTDQTAFADTIAKQFTANGWNLPTQAPSEFGVVYVQESYNAAALKLAEAAEYEKVVRPMLGWDSADGIKAAMADSPVQKEAVAKGEPPYAEMRTLLASYEKSHQTLTNQAADLTKERASLTSQLDETRNELRAKGEELNKVKAEMDQTINNKLTELNASFKDLTAKLDQKNTEAVSLQQKYQQETEGRQKDVAGLKAEVTKWRKMYEDAVAGPGEREQLGAAGKVISVQPRHGFVTIEGGKDRGVKENDVYVVYDIAPGGKPEMKGTIVVGQVNEHTSLASISEEKKYIVAGDLFVPQARWEQFQKPATAEARPGS